jgi:diaminopimelate decarboxylase
VPGQRGRRARISVEPGRAIAGPSTFTLYEVGTVKVVDLDGGASRATSPSTAG